MNTQTLLNTMGITRAHKKRHHHTLPATLVMMRKTGIRSSRVFYDIHITNYNQNGIVITWNYCPMCFGYSDTGIHHECIFKQFDYKDTNSRKLVFQINIPNTDKTYTFSGKVVYIYKQNNTEYIGITFSEIDQKAQVYLKQFFHHGK